LAVLNISNQQLHIYRLLQTEKGRRENSSAFALYMMD